MDTATKSTAVRLQLAPELMEEIRACSFDGLKALPRRGAEIGGLITFTGTSRDVAQELRLIGSEHLYGPSWRLSGSDLSALRDSVLRCEAEGKPVAAWFRSCTRPEMNVEPEDLEAIGFACPDVPFVVMAKPAMNGSAQIQLFTREPDGRWIPANELYVPAPGAKAKSEQPVAGNAPLPHKAASGNPAPPPMDARAIHESIHEMRERAVARHQLGSEHETKGPGIRTEWIVAAATVVVLVLGVAMWLRMKTSDAPRAVQSAASETSAAPVARASGPKLGLAVRDESGKYHVIWNRDSATATSAISGVLEITDGGALKSIPLLPVDITGGSIVYTPRSGDIVFRLQLRNAEGKPVEEMVRMVGGEPVARSVPVQAAPAPQTIKVLPGDPPAANSGSSVPAGRVTPTAPNNVLPPPYSRSEEPVAQPRQAAPESTKTPNVSSSNDAPSKPVNPVNPPVSQPVNQAANQALRTEGTPAVKSDPVQTSPAAPSAESRAPASAPQAPPQPSVAQSPASVPKAAAITAPQPVGRVLPTKRGLNFTLYTPTKIAVLVTVDERGRVSQAVPDAAFRGNNPFLMGRALAAAKAWTFKPATRGGRPMQGEYRIEFVFPPD